jgi:hypothetical protein
MHFPGKLLEIPDEILKWRIIRQDKFIDPSTGVGLLKSCSPDYLLL